MSVECPCIDITGRRVQCLFYSQGSLVIVNVWNMTHDPKTYQDPMVFDPTRCSHL
ncbi:hypothetical protein EV421DRAFT_1849613 [Armillaria borealis]|uniref:Uncharacterized protein n=1 Tax=Armillaria borealis TaxID=47425 RepID=A0AA39IXK7_9AGAR|nr:hypothetical protein EV421DRAFT_1849613 [Armillaria borealis]